MAKKVTLDNVRSFFTESGCVLLSEKYEGNTQPLLFVCKCSELATTTWANFRKRRRCGSCGLAIGNNKKRGYSIEQVKELFKQRGMICLDEEYKNNNTKIRYVCSCGNTSSIRLFCLLKGQKCDKCDPCRGKSHYNWNPDRDDALFRRRFRSRQRHLVASVLDAIGVSKQFKSSEIVGYTCDQLREHITTHPNWNNVKNSEWHIDHMFPIKAFLDHGIHDVKLINSLDNLRPLSAKDNLSKNDKYDKADFHAWLNKKVTNIKAIMKGELDLLLKE